MSTVSAIGSFIAIVFFVLGIAALPALRKAIRQGKKLVATFRQLQQSTALQVQEHEERIHKLETFHTDELEFRPAVLAARLEAIDVAVRTGHLRGDEGSALKAKVFARLEASLSRQCVEVKPEIAS